MYVDIYVYVYIRVYNSQLNELSTCHELIVSYIEACSHYYSQSHLGWHFRKLKAQSSNVSFATFQWKETFELWALSFQTAFENVTPSGIGCTWWSLATSVRFAAQWDIHLSRTQWDIQLPRTQCVIYIYADSTTLRSLLRRFRVHIYTFIYVFTRLYTYTYIYICIYMYAYIICSSARVTNSLCHLHIYRHADSSMAGLAEEISYTYLHVYIRIYIYIYMYTYVFIYSLQLNKSSTCHELNVSSVYIQACGLYYMAELAEEYSRLTKKILTHCIQGVIAIHVLLLVFFILFAVWWLRLVGSLKL